MATDAASGTGGANQTAGADPREPAPADLAQEVRNLGEVIASAVAGPGAPARSVGRRYDAVADQMTASLDAYGMPHEGVQLALADDEAAARSRLIDGLRRNFAYRDEDGYRTYYRSSPQPVSRDPAADGRLLRGATLVNATAVRAAADAILTAIDQLPDLDRFVAARPRRAELRERVRRVLDQLNDTAGDPTGVNVPRGRYLLGRLRVGVAEVLTDGGLLPPEAMGRFLRDQKQVRMRDPFADETSTPFEELRGHVSAVRNEEVRATALAIFQLVYRIAEVVTERGAGMGRGRAAARLEELLAAAFGSAASLEEDLNRAGTSPAEQSVLFFVPPGEPDISVGQYLGWVRAVCEPFAGAGDEAAELLYDEAGTLSAELEQLRRYAEALGALTGRPGATVGLPGVRRQLAELGRLLADAAEVAGRVRDPDPRPPATGGSGPDGKP